MDYALVSPSLDGLLSDDSLYFEGVSRPAAYYVFRDAPSASAANKSASKSASGTSSGSVNKPAGDPLVLERYWNDLYNLFLRKLSLFAGTATPQSEEIVKLQALLQELIKVKELLATGK